MKFIAYILVGFLFFFSLKFFTYIDLDLTIYGRLGKVIIILLLIYSLSKTKRIVQLKSKYPSCIYVLLFCILPIITSISCWYGHDQSIIQSLDVMLMKYILLVYFLLIITNVKLEYIVNIILFCAVIRTAFTLIQQYTYPNILFAFHTDWYDDFGNFTQVSTRNGIYRYMISDAYFLVLFAAFYHFSKIIKRFSWLHVSLFLFACLGVYMDQTRQIMFSLLLSLLIFPFLDFRKSNLKYLIIISTLLFVLYLFFDVLFGESVITTKDQLNDNYVRLYAYSYYWENTGDIITFLFGNGFASIDSDYGKEILKMEEIGLFRCDIGIVGALHLIGAVFIVFFIIYYIKVVASNWTRLPSYLKMYLISVVINIPLIFPLFNMTLCAYECFMAFVFYMVDTSIIRSKTKIN